ncbi:uncharacterized protein LOC128261518 [Drosophila gunungcola]|uniref:Uncharacterized protein n=1 Tax=Drosophila gunungcola TaxID=103775 RepID=A0A9Q0BSQ3_9MUSC|nr:uncharacterized protein LOC128261518 [Drosophila gunungcola]KAI8043322.1 hypothetical protein M5D96_004651 [Drosophila gunungcola]
MELRSRANKKLVDFLQSAGVYESGMGIEEMRELARAMENSTTDEQDLERALQESELEFLSAQPSALHNSTMIMSPQVPRRNSSSLDSPPSEPVRLTIRALVHHAMDWSPTVERRLPARKRSAVDHIQDIEQDGKRFRPPVIGDGHEEDQQQNHNPDATPVSPGPDLDSGVSWEEVSLSSVSDATSTSMASIGEMPDRHLISTSSAAVSDFSDVNEHSHD